ncbi:MAG: hypothetical protein RI895_659 [Actinomycetota bacterium]|jgi:hypothetical protein
MINNRTRIARERACWQDVLVLSCALLDFPVDKVRLAIPQLTSSKRCYILENIAHEEILTSYAQSKLIGERAAVARNGNTPPQVMEDLRHDSASGVQWAIAGNESRNLWEPPSIGDAYIDQWDQIQFADFDQASWLFNEPLLEKINSLHSWSQISKFWHATRLPATYVASFLLRDEDLKNKTFAKVFQLTTESIAGSTAWKDRRSFEGSISEAFQTSAFFTNELVEWILIYGNDKLKESLSVHPGIWLDELEQLFPNLDFGIREITSTDLHGPEIRFRLVNELSGSQDVAIRNLFRMCSDNKTFIDQFFYYAINAMHEIGPYKGHQSFS